MVSSKRWISHTEENTQDKRKQTTMTLFHACSTSILEAKDSEIVQISGKDFRILLREGINNHMGHPNKQKRDPRESI